MNDLAKTNACPYCGKTFRTEKTLMVHMCEARRRIEQEKDPAVQLGYMGFQRFNQLNGIRKERSYSDFAGSPYYKAFHRWAIYCRNSKVVDPMIYLDWLLKQQVKIDRWNTDRVYDSYLKELLYNERVDDALARSWQTFNTWAEENNSVPTHYLLYASQSRMTSDIMRGRLSPWLLYVSQAGQKVLENFNSEQLSLIMPYIDPDRWLKKIDKNIVDLTTVKHWLKDKGIDE